MYSLGAEIREKAEREGKGRKGKIERNISAVESFYGYC